MAKKDNLEKAKKNKNDEFYTRRQDIERELKNYKNHFNNKIVFAIVMILNIVIFTSFLKNNLIA